MFFRQYQLGCLSLFSYLIGDRTSGRAVVVDPSDAMLSTPVVPMTGSIAGEAAAFRAVLPAQGAARARLPAQGAAQALAPSAQRAAHALALLLPSRVTGRASPLRALGELHGHA